MFDTQNQNNDRGLMIGAAIGVGQRLRGLETEIGRSNAVAYGWQVRAKEGAARAARAERRLQEALDEVADLRAAVARLRRQR